MRCVAERLYMMTSVASVISADEELGAMNSEYTKAITQYYCLTLIIPWKPLLKSSVVHVLQRNRHKFASSRVCVD